MSIISSEHIDDETYNDAVDLIYALKEYDLTNPPVRQSTDSLLNYRRKLFINIQCGYYDRPSLATMEFEGSGVHHQITVCGLSGSFDDCLEDKVFVFSYDLKKFEVSASTSDRRRQAAKLVLSFFDEHYQRMTA